MLRSRIIAKINTDPDYIAIEKSLCLKTKFETGKCSKCKECCPAGAVKTDMELDINKRVCTECMLCVAECPSGAIDLKSVNFLSIILKLRKIPMPVLGCSSEHDIKAHVNTVCLGFLSEEHLIALSVFIEKPLQLNLTQCKTCKNTSVTHSLQKRLEAIRVKTSIAVKEKIRLVEDNDSLEFLDTVCDRRSFFDVLKKYTFEGAANLLDTASDNKKPKLDEHIPFRRLLLNKTIAYAAQKAVKEIMLNYYYDIAHNNNCDKCNGCTAICPAGALKRDYYDTNNPLEGVSGDLLFNASYCYGCGLCEEFCLNRAIVVKQGYTGNAFSEFTPLKRND